MNYPWPGNVRELRNVIERAVLLSKHPVLGPDDLVLGRTDPAAGLIVVLPNEGIDLQTVEEDLLKQALARTNNNQTKAAKLLRLSRDQLRYRMERYGLL